MHCDDIAVFDAKVMPDNSVHASAAIIKVVIGQNDEHGVSSLLALDKNRVATEKL